MYFMWLLLVVLNSAFQIPAVGRPHDHFLGAVGHHITIELHAEPRVMVQHQSFILSVIIVGAWNSSQLVRPDLHRFEDYTHDFVIEDAETLVLPPSKRVFRYRLRPRRAGLQTLPPFLMRYWDPLLRYFATAISENDVAIDVAPIERKSPVEVWDEESKFLFDTPSIDTLADDLAPSHRPVVLMALAAIGPYCVWFGWYVLRGIRHSRGLSNPPIDQSIRNAESTLTAAMDNVCSRAEQARIVEEAVRVLGYAHSVLEAPLRELIRRCQRLRFGPENATDETLIADALAIVRQYRRARS
jgi:hypothetical protein